MVWEEILIGFTVAGFVAVLVPASFWAKIFLIDAGGSVPGWLILIENAAVAPLVAAATFIGSMGNIPLATVLGSNGVLFAGIMGFIYSDLMVPPLVAINAKYYGRRIALYIAGIMFVSIVITAITLHVAFSALGITPESQRAVEEVSQFALDYTFWLNLVMVAVTGIMVWLHRQHVRGQGEADGDHDHGTRPGIKRIVVYLMIFALQVGVASWILSQL